jgi:hypothetical protein
LIYLSGALVRLSILLLGVATLSGLVGCAEPKDDPSTPEGGAAPSAGGGGAGGEGGLGGLGGEGGLGIHCPIDCTTIETPPCVKTVCNLGLYEGPVGACVLVPDDAGVPCDDGLYCTIEDACDGEGACAGGAPNHCGLDEAACNDIACDESKKSCTLVPSGDGESCQYPHNPCVLGSSCIAGECVGGYFNDCFFEPVPNACHVSMCNPTTGQCEPLPGNDDATCVDTADLCTVNKTCSAGACVGGVPKDCSNLTEDCNLGECDTTTGACVATPLMEGDPCDDLDGCTSGEVCTTGSCLGGMPVTACSVVPDGCCPTGCTAANDDDCGCLGEVINGHCVYLLNKLGVSFSSAQSQCQALGTGWDLCSTTLACDAATHTYLGAEGCVCGGGDAVCACGSGPNVYVHVTGGTSPYYIRAASITSCGSAACTNSVSETCGAPLCCRTFP